ncbi:hypothetical protein AZE42_10605 [Rhizopogon vesiculosus]|uniref:Uncharacterized protein n=1 Tax=Rhizopogon vesiculosus TaxID=180088 RepID=A0A1J8PMV5_9AGAM|nr:hypothetical protein AZE42_10605 [Rhizopogon vesiculosus]
MPLRQTLILSVLQHPPQSCSITFIDVTPA